MSSDSTLHELLVEPGVSDSGFHIIFPSHYSAVFAGGEFRRAGEAGRLSAPDPSRALGNSAARFV